MADYPVPWIPALWAAWALYWAFSAAGRFRVVKAEGSSRFHYRVPLVLAALALLGPRLWPELDGRIIPETVTGEVLGTVLLALGLGLAVVARVHLGVHWSGRIALGADHHLVRSGPYRFMRHPIYSGVLLAFAGTAVAFGDWRSVVALAIAVAALWTKLRREERMMAARFAGEYADYQARVAALVPGLL